jgi:putative ABC transport system substrate-binding protein
MQRRSFLTLLGTSAAAWPLAARAQQDGRVRLIAITQNFAETDPEWLARAGALLQALRQRGWVEGRNIRIASRSSTLGLVQIRAMGAELLALNPDLIIVTNTPLLQELLQQTRTIPIVFIGLGDPVETGVVPALARPGGNVTGFMNFEPVMGGKYLELLKDGVPAVKRVLILVAAGNPVSANVARTAAAAALALHVQPTISAVHSAADIEPAISAIAAEPNASLVVMPGTPLTDNHSLVVALANRHRLPAVYPQRVYVRDGGLMSFDSEPTDQWRQAAFYVDRIMRGEKPGDLPVQAPVKYELLVNLKTAKAIGLTIPETFLVRADEVIE